MPLTPFLGLSVAVHLFVIVANYFLRFNKNRKTNTKPATPLMHFFSFLLIFLVFGIVLTTAFSMVYASLTDQYSSVKVASRYINSLNAKVVADISKEATALNATEEIEKEENLVVACYDQSVVNFLYRKGLDYSFEAREVMAGIFGMSDYRGTAKENKLLLQYLIIELGEVERSDVSSCKK